jgi:hypothetical protein
MATVTHAGSAWTTTAGNKTLTATPAANDLIVVIAPATGVATSSVTDNNADGLGTYTQVDSDRTGWSTAGHLSVWVRTALVGSATSTVFTAAQAGSTGGGLDVFRISGMTRTGTAAVRQSNGQSTGTSGTTPAPAMGSAVLTGNPVIGAACCGTNASTNFTPRTGWTEATDLGYNVPAAGMETAFISSGETGTTLTWGSTAPSAFASVAVELDASAPVSSADTASGSDRPTKAWPASADSTHARDGGYGFGGDWAHAAEAASAAPAGTGISGSDTGHGAEAARSPVVRPAGEAPHGADAGSVHAALSSADSAHAADLGQRSGNPLGFDTAHAAEAAPPLRVTGAADAGHAADAPAVTAAVTKADTGHGTDAASPARVTAADSAHALEQFWDFGGDWARAAEAASVNNGTTPHSADSGHAAEVPVIRVSAADSGHGTDNGIPPAIVWQAGTPAAPAVTTTSGTVTGAWSGSQPRTAGHLLVAGVTAAAAVSSTAISTPAGWTKLPEAVGNGGRARACFFTAVAAGGDAAPTFTSTLAGGASQMACELWELAGQGPVPADTYGTVTAAVSTTVKTCTTTGNVAVAGEYALSAWTAGGGTAGAVTWTPGSGWANQGADGASGVPHAAFDYYAGPPAGSALAETGTISTAEVSWAGVILVVSSALGPVPVSSADSGSGAEASAVRIPGADSAHAAEAGSVHAAVPGADSGHAAEHGAVPGTPSGSDTAHAAEAPSVHAALPGADSGHGAEAPSVHAALGGADSAHAAEGTPSARVAGHDAASAAEGPAVHAAVAKADTGHAAEGSAVRAAGTDSGHAADAGGVHAALAGPDTGHAAEGFAVRVSRADAGHGLEGSGSSSAPASADSAHAAESGTVHAALPSADSAHAAEHGVSSGGQQSVSSADSGLAVESAFYYHASADAGSAAEGGTPSIRVTGKDRGFSAEAPLSAWPSRADAARTADRPASAWPAGDDVARAAEGWKPFRFSLADSAHVTEVLHEMGIWTYVPVNVRLLGKLWRVTGTDERGAEVVILEADRLTGDVLEFAGRVSWSRVTTRVRSGDSAVAAERVTREPVGVTCTVQPAVAVSVTVTGVREPVPAAGR